MAVTDSSRRTSSGTGSSGRGILSMAALSHSVVRVDKENSLTSLTLQVGSLRVWKMFEMVSRQAFLSTLLNLREIFRMPAK